MTRGRGALRRTLLTGLAAVLGSACFFASPCETYFLHESCVYPTCVVPGTGATVIAGLSDTNRVVALPPGSAVRFAGSQPTGFSASDFSLAFRCEAGGRLDGVDASGLRNTDTWQRVWSPASARRIASPGVTNTGSATCYVGAVSLTYARTRCRCDDGSWSASLDLCPFYGWSNGMDAGRTDANAMDAVRNERDVIRPPAIDGGTSAD